MMDTDAVVLCATQQSKLNISHVDNFLSAIVEAWLEERKKRSSLKTFSRFRALIIID